MKKKPPIQLSLDMGNQDKVGLLVYNLALSANTDEMYEAANVWRYKHAISESITKLRKLQEYGFTYTKTTYDTNGKITRELKQDKKAKIDHDAFDHIIQEVVKTLEENLDGLGW